MIKNNKKQQKEKVFRLPKGKPINAKEFMAEVRRIRNMMLKNDPNRFKDYERMLDQ